MNVDLIDPHASPKEFEHEYGHILAAEPTGKYDAIIVAVNHAEYMNKPESYFKELMHDGKGVFVDLKGVYKDQIHDLEYWSL